ncbi:MAG TPA: ATP-binding cassette domain-containing protein [Solirubrobacteraceae bacterium]|nr:ATP-binding cassette domain-containing protein [Solirubrobacteraceae bacterium]
MGRPLLSAHEIVRTLGPRTILRSVSLAVDDRSRTALVGPNGSGKSTLMRILAGELDPDGGRVVRGRGAAVLYLPQLDATGDVRPVRAILHERLGVAAAETRMDALAAELAAGRDVVQAHAEALEQWLARGGADVDARLDQAAATGELDAALLDRPAAELSGGQRARAMLAAIEAARADVLLLDEPANHLDAAGLERLRALLLARAGGIVLVAHDRELLAAVTNQVVELDPHTGAAREFAGGWAAYETERQRAHRRALEAHERAVAERDRLRSRELAMRGRGDGVRRRSAAETDKYIRHAMRQSAQRSADGLAAGIARRIERIEIPDAPWESSAPALPFAAGGSRSGIVVALRDAVLVRGEFTLGPLDLEVRDGDRVLLAGPNGSGKSTVLAALAGRLAPSRGSVHRVDGAVAELGQERGSLLAQDSPDLVSAVRAHAGLGERQARAALAAMGLDKVLVARPPATLSPGERTRAELAAATAAGARLLLLDEPTNHLDVEALQALETALAGWPGALVVATHDARLRDGLELDVVVDVTADAISSSGR